LRYISAYFGEETGAFHLRTSANAIIAFYARSRAVCFLSLQVLFDLQRSIFKLVILWGLFHCDKEECIGSTAAVSSDGYWTTARSNSERMGRYELGLRSTRDIMLPTDLARVALLCTGKMTPFKARNIYCSMLSVANCSLFLAVSTMAAQPLLIYVTSGG